MKQVSSAFTTERRHLLEIIDGLTEGVIFLNLDGRIAWANDSALKMHHALQLSDLGKTATEYLQRYPLRDGKRQALEAKQYPMARALAGEHFHDLAIEITAPQDRGVHRILQVRSIALDDVRGEPEGVALILLDVTQQRGSAAQLENGVDAPVPLRAVETVPRQNEEPFSKAFRLAPVPMLISSAEGKIIEVNDAFVRTTGYPCALMTQGNGTLMQLLCDPQRYEEALAALAGGGSLSNLALSLCTRDGQFLDCLISAEAIFIQDQRCILTILQDITERKRSEADLMAAIQAVMQDTSWFSQTVIEKLAQIRQPQFESEPGAELADLTPREREILGLMCQDMTDPEIALSLNVSPHTVRNHVASLYSKLDVHRRSAAIIWARQRGIVC